MKTKFNVVVIAEYNVSLEQQMEMLAYIRYSLRNFTNVFPETVIMSGREPTNEEIMEAIHGDSQSREHCFYYDEAQGRHHCTNPVVKSSCCLGVCKDYKPK